MQSAKGVVFVYKVFYDTYSEYHVMAIDDGLPFSSQPHIFYPWFITTCEHWFIIALVM